MPWGLGRACRMLCLAIACGALAESSVARAQTNAVAASVETLDNGMRVVVIEDHAAPVVATGMWYRFGADDERPAKSGLAHALAHMMFEGTPSVSSAGLDDVISRLGAKASATTSNDYTVYRFVLPAEKLELALRIEADRMQHLLISDAAWARVKNAVLGEQADDLGRPLTKLYADVCRAAATFPVCAGAPFGDRADVARAVAGDVRSYYQDWYAPNNATLVVSGDVQTDEVQNLARSIFAPIPRGDLPDRASRAPFYSSDKRINLGGDFPYDVVDLAFPAPAQNDPDTAAFRVVDAVVTNRRSNFYKALVRSGYTLGYSTELDQTLRGGLYHVFLVVAPGHSDAQASGAFLGVVRTAQTDGFSDDLVRAAKIAISRRTVYAQDSISGIGELAGYAIAVEGASALGRDDDHVASTTNKAIGLVIRKYLLLPAVTGVLATVPSRTGAPSGPPVTSVTDDFSRRAPVGPVVEARFVRDPLAQPLELETRLRPVSFTLPNGLRVLVQEAHANPTVFIEGEVQTSPRLDPPGKDGAGAMVATLLDDGSISVPGDERRRVTDELGASMHVGTSFDAHGRAEDCERLIGLIADALRHPAFRPAAVDAVRKQTLAAVQQSEQDPDFRADADFDQLLLRPDDPTLRTPTEDSIERIRIADLRSYARSYLRPDLTVLTVAGDVSAAAVRKIVYSAFGDWRNAGLKPNLDPGPLPEPHASLRYVVANRRVALARLGTVAVAHASADFPALDVINEILGAQGAFDTRLASTLRTRLGLATWIESMLLTDRYRGTLEFRLTAPPKNLGRAVGVLRDELERLHDDPVGPFELDRARTKIVAGGFVSEESTQVVVTRVQTIGLDGLPLDYERTLPRRYAALDGAAIENAATAYLHPDSLVEVTEGPPP